MTSGDAVPILLVEDNENDVLLVQRAFRKAEIRHPLVVLRDGDAAVEYLGGAGPYADRIRYPLPAVMLLDLKLPRRSGHEVLGWLRMQPGLRRLPVVILSSSRDLGDVGRAYDGFANSYLVKPVHADQLSALVRDVERYWLVRNLRPELG